VTTTRRRRILVVDDSPERLAAFQHRFGSAGRYVPSYTDGVEALATGAFEEVWLDFDLGSTQNGADLAFWMRRLPRQRRPKVFIHSENAAGALSILLTLRGRFDVEMRQPLPRSRPRRGA
jgi:CheY-like chemotaxis protein